MSTDQRERLDELDRVLRRARPGRPALTDAQRQIIMGAFEHAAPFTATQRLRLVRMMRTSDRWARLRAAGQQYATAQP